MKKFIAFMIVALPLTAFLSMAAGFWYAGQTRLERFERQILQPTPVKAVPAVRVEPTVEAQPSISASEYASHIRVAISGCASGVLKLGNLFGNPQVKSESWRIRMGTVLRGIDECVSKIRAEQPPALVEAQEIHRDAMALADEFEAVSKEMRAGVETQDLDRIVKATDRYLEIGRLIDILDAKTEAAQ